MLLQRLREQILIFVGIDAGVVQKVVPGLCITHLALASGTAFEASFEKTGVAYALLLKLTVGAHAFAIFVDNSSLHAPRTV